MGIITIGETSSTSARRSKHGCKMMSRKLAQYYGLGFQRHLCVHSRHRRIWLIATRLMLWAQLASTFSLRRAHWAVRVDGPVAHHATTTTLAHALITKGRVIVCPLTTRTSPAEASRRWQELQHS